MKRFLLYFTGQAARKQFFMHWLQQFHAAGLYSTFSFVVNQNRALFGLFQRMATDFNETFNHKVKRIDIIIVEYQFIFLISFLQYKYVLFPLSLWFVVRMCIENGWFHAN